MRIQTLIQKNNNYYKNGAPDVDKSAAQGVNIQV